MRWELAMLASWTHFISRSDLLVAVQRSRSWYLHGIVAEGPAKYLLLTARENSSGFGSVTICPTHVK